MNIDKLIKNQEQGLEILEAIRMMERRKKMYLENANGNFIGSFPELKKKYLHKADIADRVIVRLWGRFLKNHEKNDLVKHVKILLNEPS